jgi:hypothetical protein
MTRALAPIPPEGASLGAMVVSYAKKAPCPATRSGRAEPRCLGSSVHERARWAQMACGHLQWADLDFEAQQVTLYLVVKRLQDAGASLVHRMHY